jgi:hypothetical protein
MHFLRHAFIGDDARVGHDFLADEALQPKWFTQ